MGRGIRITAGPVAMDAELADGVTAGSIWEALPIRGSAQTWGDEIYFSIPVESPLEDGARDVVEAGELGYWPPGSAFCIFFGPTPASQGDEIRAASPVNIVGSLSGEPAEFKKVKSGTKVTISRRE